MNVIYKLMRNTEVFAEATYRKQESDGSVFRNGLDNDNYRIAIGFRYDFRPIHF